MDEATSFSSRVYMRQKRQIRLYLRRRTDGTWSLVKQRLMHINGTVDTRLRAQFVTSETLIDLGPMRTKDALRVLDGAWRLFKLEHARETA